MVPAHELCATWTKMKSPQKCWVLGWERGGQAETIGDGDSPGAWK